jgi:hypothetical protein
MIPVVAVCALPVVVKSFFLFWLTRLDDASIRFDPFFLYSFLGLKTL